MLLSKPRSYAEVYNDLDDEIVNLFAVVRDSGPELLRAIELTPYARTEFDLSFKACCDPVERARRTIVRSLMGFGGNVTRPNRDGTPQRTGWRTYTELNRRSTPCRDFESWPEGFEAIIFRMRGVVIERRPAIDVMRAYDSEEALHYVDPPYVHSTRQFDAGGTHRAYRHEMSDNDHRALAGALRALVGKVMLSGYACDLYDCELFADWNRLERKAMADGARERTEVLYLNFDPAETQPELFAA